MPVLTLAVVSVGLERRVHSHQVLSDVGIIWRCANIRVILLVTLQRFLCLDLAEDVLGRGLHVVQHALVPDLLV